MDKATKDNAEALLELPKISLEDAIKRLDPQYDLVYVDYRDQFSEKQLAEIVATGFCDSLDDNGWMGDQQWDSVHQIVDETFKDVDISDIEDALREEIWERDRSDVVKDLLRNTSEPVMYYDLDVEIDGYTEDLVKRAKQVAKALKLNYKNHEGKFKTLVANASYGGKLVLMYRGDVDLFYGEKDKPKYVVICNPEVCIMDRWNGSGHSMDGFGDFKVRFDRTRFKLDEEAPGYSFAGDVCGMVVEVTGLREAKGSKGVIGPKLPRVLSAKEKQEIEDEKRWNSEKKCRLGDMNPNRHANTKYINEYPCGTHCMDCKTFWVD